MTIEGIIRALIQTLLVWSVSLGIALVLAVLVAYFRMSRRRVLRWVAIVYIRVLRGVPPLSWMFLLYFGIA
ncbi:hypothetical protein QV65_24215 [Rhodococcus erythropolis]|nr:hypothetical protein QV65_24215 [Rhodococcus erythropolis]